ncbi:MAG: S8/S53 family peptidase, partial [Acidimicrobiales bacterium]
RVLVSPAERAAAERRVRATPGVEVVDAGAGGDLPVVAVEVAGPGAVAALRRLPQVDYLEPRRLDAGLHAGAPGCVEKAEDEWRGGVAYAGPGAKDAAGDLVPWNFDHHKVRDAWRRSAGAGVTVGVVDTGVYREQRELNEDFATGTSTGRSITHLNTSASSYLYDECNHGTRMVSTVAGPRNGKDLVGVAWKAGIVSVKAQNDVVLDSGDSAYAARAISAAAWRSRIVTMAFGHPFDWHSNVADTIRYHHYNRGVLFVAAAGTKPSWIGCGVIFPAKMAEVVAVAGALPSGAIHPESCNGPEVDAKAVIGDWDPKVEVPASGRHQGHLVNMGGSSEATAVVSGIAALVWSRYPTWTRDQVRNRLLASRTTGGVDAYAAVGGFTSLYVEGPASVEPGTTYTLTARPRGDGPFSYLWSSGETTPSITRTAGPVRTSQTASVTVTDLAEQRSLSASKTVTSEYLLEDCIRYCP